MKIQATWEFDSDVNDFDPKFVDIAGLALESAKQELKYLLEHDELNIEDFTFKIKEK